MIPSTSASSAAQELLEKYSSEDLESSWMGLKPFLPDPFSPTDARFHPSVCCELLQDVASGKEYSSFFPFGFYALDYRTEEKFKERIDAGNETLNTGDHAPVKKAAATLEGFRTDFSMFLKDHQGEIAKGCGLNLADLWQDAGKATEPLFRLQRVEPSPPVNRNRVMDSGGLPRVMQAIVAVFSHP